MLILNARILDYEKEPSIKGYEVHTATPENHNHTDVWFYTFPVGSGVERVFLLRRGGVHDPDVKNLRPRKGVKTLGEALDRLARVARRYAVSATNHRSGGKIKIISKDTRFDSLRTRQTHPEAA